MKGENWEETDWVVAYGPKDRRLRENKSFASEEAALKFYREKEKTMHVDVYKVTRKCEKVVVRLTPPS